MKVAWIHSFDKKSNKNAGVFMFQLLEALRKKGILIDEFYTGKITPFTLFSTFLNLRKVTLGYDIIHAQYGSGCGLVSSYLNGYKILTLRGSDWYVSAESDSIKSYFHTRLAVFMSKWSLRRYDKIITMSEKMTSEVKNYSKKSSITTIIDGIDLDKFTPKNKFDERTKMGENDENPWVLFSSVAENNPLKRYELANKAIEKTKETIPALKLKFMTGIDHENVPNFISTADVILLTSTHEGWPNIIKEGLALNIPFVSTDVSDLKNIALIEKSCTIVKENKEEQQMVNEISNGILKAIAIAKTEKLHLRKYVEEMNIENCIKELITIYNKSD